jgi:hypothetical protein
MIRLWELHIPRIGKVPIVRPDATGGRVAPYALCQRNNHASSNEALRLIR